jgi:uncharacterized protein involved in response to NO
VINANSVHQSGRPGRTVQPAISNRTIAGASKLHNAAQPAGNLPVTARPTMLSHRISVIVGRIVIEKFDITDQGRARKDRFKQIVAQQGTIWNSIVECFLKSIYVIETLSRIAAFAEKILVHVRCCRRIRIDTGVARKGPRK